MFATYNFPTALSLQAVVDCQIIHILNGQPGNTFTLVKRYLRFVSFIKSPVLLQKTERKLFTPKVQTVSPVSSKNAHAFSKHLFHFFCKKVCFYGQRLPVIIVESYCILNPFIRIGTLVVGKKHCACSYAISTGRRN